MIPAFGADATRVFPCSVCPSRHAREYPLACSIRPATFACATISILPAAKNHHHGITNGCKCHKAHETKKESVSRAGAAYPHAFALSGGRFPCRVCAGGRRALAIMLVRRRCPRLFACRPARRPTVWWHTTSRNVRIVPHKAL